MSLGLTALGKYVRRRGSKLLALALFAGLAGTMASQCSYDSAVVQFAGSPHSEDDGLNALFDAVEGGKGVVVVSLLRMGVDINQRASSDQTALMRAVIADRPDMCEVLIDHGADIEGTTSTGWNPLMLAAVSKNEPIVKLLLARGAEVDATIWNGRTALMASCTMGSSQTAALLIAAGADVNAVAKDGTTPMVGAVDSQAGEMPELIRMLTDAGAKVSVPGGPVARAVAP